VVEDPPEPGNAGLLIICGHRRGFLAETQEKLSEKIFVW
jgi:hypothetical protein